MRIPMSTIAVVSMLMAFSLVSSKKSSGGNDDEGSGVTEGNFGGTPSISYHCDNSACKWDNFVRSKDWGMYPNTKGDCTSCKERCDLDDRCGGVECGRDTCSWWAVGKCAIEQERDPIPMVKTCIKEKQCASGFYLSRIWSTSVCLRIGNWMSCTTCGRPFMVHGISRTTTSETCNIDNPAHTASWKMGQAPSISANNPHNQEIGRRWLKNAEGEHASVASFARHTLQLMSIGAPSELLIASQSASVDEIKHAKMSYGIASAFLGSDFGPGTIDVDDGLANMDLNEIIQSVIQEGCIEETLSAMEAHLAARNAQDGAIKDTLLEIASDETNHAQLAWDTINWSIERYPDTRTFVEESFRAALAIVYGQENNDFLLPPTSLGTDSEKDASFRKYGILASGDREKLRKVGIRDIIAPVFLDGFMDVTSISKQIIKLSVAIP